jgi:ELWxxDGT repeat protein
MRHFTSLLAAIALTGTIAPSQVKLVKDLNPGAGGSSAGTGFATVGETVYFQAHDGKAQGLWKTGGTAATTVKVKGITAGALTAFGSRVYFRFGNTTIGQEMYVSDGTPAGTVLFKEFVSGFRGGEPRNLRRVGNRMYFAAQGAKNNHELWRTDGTASGTVLVKEINPAGPSNPADITPIGSRGRFVFTADEATFGRELYISDGTATGTKLVKDIWPGGGFRDSK